MTKILHIDSSGRKRDSISRQLSRELVDKLAKDQADVTYRDVSQGLPYVSETMIESYFTDKSARTDSLRRSIEVSDAIVEELVDSDTIVIGVPMYNFSMPAGLKAWCDLVARVGETFRYTENGPVGLLEGKRAFIIVASGGVKVDSDYDYLTPWLRQFLRFIGIDDIEVVAADTLTKDPDKALSNARLAIDRIAKR